MKKIKAFLLRTLTKKKRTTFENKRINSILIFRYDRIGDLIVSLPLIYALKKGFPSAKICVIASQSNFCIAEDSDLIDEVIIKPQSLIRWIKILIKKRIARPSLILDLNHAVTPHTILATLMIQPIYTGTPFKDGRWGVKGSELQLFDIMPERHSKGYNRPISQTYLDIARLLKCPTDGCFPYPLPKYHSFEAMRQPYIVLNPCGSRLTMCLKQNDIIALSALILGIAPKTLIIVPSTHSNYALLIEITKNCSNVRVLEPKNTIRPILPLVQFCSLVITPDTALVHIATAYKIPLVAVYTADDELFQQWRPLNLGISVVIRSEHKKTLSSYSSNDLLAQCERMIKEHTLNE